MVLEHFNFHLGVWQAKKKAWATIYNSYRCTRDMDYGQAKNNVPTSCYVSVCQWTKWLWCFHKKIRSDASGTVLDRRQFIMRQGDAILLLLEESRLSFKKMIPKATFLCEDAKVYEKNDFFQTLWMWF